MSCRCSGPLELLLYAHSPPPTQVCTQRKSNGGVMALHKKHNIIQKQPNEWRHIYVSVMINASLEECSVNSGMI